MTLHCYFFYPNYYSTSVYSSLPYYAYSVPEQGQREVGGVYFTSGLHIERVLWL